MKKIIVVFLVFFIHQVSFSQIIYNIEDAQKLALATNKLIVVDFWASWCGPCKKMESDVWNNAGVKPVLDNFVFAKIDFDSNKSLASKYNVNAIPNILIIDANGTLIEQNIGYMNLSNTNIFLNPYSLNTEFFSNEAIAYYKNANFTTALRLGVKYLDFSLFLDEKVTNKFLNLAIFYLEQAEKKIEKKDENFKEKKQQIEILQLSKFAYSNNYEKLEKKISDYKKDEIKTNLAKSYINFYEYLIALNNNKSDEFLKSVNEEDFAALKSKADLIFKKYQPTN